MARGRRSPVKRKGKKGGNPLASAALYGVVVAAGTFGGMQLYSQFLQPPAAKGKSVVAKQSSVFTDPQPEHPAARKPDPAPSHSRRKPQPVPTATKPSATAEPLEDKRPTEPEKPVAHAQPALAKEEAPAANRPGSTPAPEIASSELPRVSVSPGAEPVAPAPLPISPEVTLPKNAQSLNAPRSTGLNPTPAPVPLPTPRKPLPAPAVRPAFTHPVKPIEIDKGSGKRPEVALTFDAGSDWKPVKKILDALAGQGVKATFFLTGEWVKKNPKTTRLIVEAGHELGNHSWDHPPFTRLTDAQIQDQLRKTDEMIQEVAGRSTRPWFRPPLGDRDGRVRQLVSDAGYFTVYWTLDSRDSVDRGITSQQIRDRVLGKVAPGSIVLMHCGSQATADALPAILDGLRSRGLTNVPISRLLQSE